MKRTLVAQRARAARILVVVVSSVIAACGGASDGAASSGTSTSTSTSGGATTSGGTASAGGEHPGGEAGEHHGEGGERHAHGLPAGPVNDFHEVLAPLWHSEDNPERTTRTCAQAPALRRHASAIVDGPAPEQAAAHADGWRSAAAALRDSLAPLETECATTERRAVPARLADVHTAFHHLMENLERH